MTLFLAAALVSLALLLRGSSVPIRSITTLWAVSIFFLLPLAVFTTKALAVPQLAQVSAAVLFALASLAVIATKLVSRAWRRLDFLTVVPLLLIACGLAVGEFVNRRPFEPIYLATFAAILGLVLFSRSEVSQILAIALRCTIAICAASIVVLFVQPSLVTTNFSSLNLASGIEGRLAGPFFHPNALGTIGALASPLALSNLRGSHRLIAMIVLGSAVFLSDQRAAWLATILSVAVYFSLKRRTSLIHWYNLTLAVMLGLFVIVFFAASTVAQVASLRSDSISAREEIYGYFFGDLSQMLPFGIGPGGIYEVTRGIFLVPVAHAHNAWLTFLVAGGLVAGAAFMFLFLRGCVICIRQGDIGRISFLSGVAVISLVESPSFVGSNWTLLPVAFMAIAAWLAYDADRQPKLAQTTGANTLSDRL